MDHPPRTGTRPPERLPLLSSPANLSASASPSHDVQSIWARHWDVEIRVCKKTELAVPLLSIPRGCPFSTAPPTRCPVRPKARCCSRSLNVVVVQPQPPIVRAQPADYLLDTCCRTASAQSDAYLSCWLSSAPPLPTHTTFRPTARSELSSFYFGPVVA